MTRNAAQPGTAAQYEAWVDRLAATAEKLRIPLDVAALRNVDASTFSYATGRVDQATYLRSLRATRSGNRQSNPAPREPRVCIGCGRRDTRDPSCICSNCRRRVPGSRERARREDRTFQAHGCRACPPGPPLTADDMESPS